MIDYRYNEEEYAKQIEKSGFLTKYHNYELTLLVKLWKKNNIKPKQRKEKIYKFCEKYIENFNDVKFFRKINAALKNGSKKDNPLINIEKIPITDKEIQYINDLDIEYNYKKVIFCLLVNMKIKKEICKIKYSKNIEGNYISGTQKRYNEILKVSKISNTYKINDIINVLEKLGLIDVRTRGKINLLFIKNIEDSCKIIFNINTFDNIGYYFDWYNGDKKIIRCENCGKLIRQSANNRKYCRSCAREVLKEQWKDASKKYYHSHKSENPSKPL